MSLVDKLQQKWNKREDDERREKLLETLLIKEKEIKEAPIYAKKEFWCKKCKKDFIGVGIKSVIESYTIAKYNCLCRDCGSLCYRRITDKNRDEYYVLSDKQKRLRQEAEIDMIQPGDPRFKKYYHKEWLELERKKEYEQNN